MRYFLLREVPFGQDGSYSEDAIISRINADLANELGNLAQRSLSMVAKNLDGIVPDPTATSPTTTATAGAGRRAAASRCAGISTRQAMHLALEAIWLVLGAANRYFSAQEPWVLRKSEAESDQARFGTVLYTTLEVVRIAALLVQPVMPDSAAKLLDLLGQPADQRDRSPRSAPGWRPAPRCPRRPGCSRATRWSEARRALSGAARILSRQAGLMSTATTSRRVEAFHVRFELGAGHECVGDRCRVDAVCE